MFFDPERPNPRFQRRRRHAQPRRSAVGSGDATAGFLQYRFDLSALVIAAGRRYLRRRLRSRRCLSQSSRLETKYIAVCENDAALDDVLQLAYVSRPRVLL